jgi:phosphoribosylaminoimidazole-succinocarboxamide synthase
MQKREFICQGKAKVLYATDDSELAIVCYKDDATAFNGLKKGVISGKGIVNNKISNRLMRVVEDAGVPTHFVRELSDRESLVKRVQILPLEVIVRNVAAGTLAKRLGIPEGTKILRSVLEFCYKKDELGDPMINTTHILAMGFASAEDLKLIAEYSQRINAALIEFLKSVKVDLIDFKIEFGKTASGELVLADEISPDTCRFWDSDTGEKLDKDRFRRDLGGVEEAYNEMLKRVLSK